MSSDVTTAYVQGVNAANLAVESLAALGLTNPDKTGSVVYYDIENYGTETACRAAVNSFMNGWVSQIRARGSLAGVYGSTLCNTGLSDFQNITNVPDVIWPARWYHNLGSGYYDPTADVWNLGSCIPNTVWSNHQRIRQYEGDHNETWGGLTLSIDSNVLDGIVAMLHDYPFVDSIVRADPNPTNAAVVGFTVHFSEAVTGVNKGDFVLTTTGVTDASIKTVSGAGSTYSVTVNTGFGNGTIRLDVVDNSTIIDDANNPLGGVGSGNGDHSTGAVYTIDKSIPVDTTGVFRPTNGLLYLKNSNTSGFADVAINYGLAGDYPVVGDWDGNGTTTIGIYRNGSFYLRNSNTIGYADAVFPFGEPGDQPIAGDWDGDGIDTIGVYRNGTFFLRNENSAGAPDASFSLGNPGDVGIAGDWNGDRKDTTGVFRPSNGALYLKNTNATGFADIQINYGLPGDKPVTGDWNNDGIDTIGVYRNGTFYLRNANTIGYADIVFALGIPGDMPIAGNWDGQP
jgi:Rv2525c-like, glycoside hydrolase-like domain